MSATDSKTIDYKQVITALPQLDAVELTEVIRTSTRLKKKIVVPSQMDKGDKWIEYALGDAQLNGWSSFVTRTTKMDKSMGEKIIEEVLMRESVQREDGVHVFADTKKEMTAGQAYWYSKMLKDNGYALYAEFSELYSKITGLPLRKPLRIVRKTSAQVEEEEAKKVHEKAEEEAKKVREKAEKEAEKAKEKAMEKAAKEALKAEKEAKKVREKAMEKAAKEALKAEKEKAAKDAKKVRYEQCEKESRKKSLESFVRMKNYEEEKKAERQREEEKEAEKQREEKKAEEEAKKKAMKEAAKEVMN
jgi:hypothetical protein